MNSDLYDVLQLVSTVAVGTLGIITLVLSRRRNVHLFIGVGQDVFRWCSLVLGVVMLSRLLIVLRLLDNPQSRAANSVVFILAVVGIIGNVLRHGKSK